MLMVFKDAGYEVSSHIEDGVVGLSFDILPTEQSKAVQLSREHRAESRSMRTILYLERVAIVGASRREDSIGAPVLRNLIQASFQGELYLIHREAAEIQGLRAYPTILDAPGPVDLAIVVVPAATRSSVVEDCGRGRGQVAARPLLWLAEARGGGLRPCRTGCARRHGEPGCGSSARTASASSTTPPASGSTPPRVGHPRRGRLGLFAQSGASASPCSPRRPVGGLGISVFASAGNRVDVSGNDLMQYWIDDQDTTTVGLYLESMGNPRKFSRIARHLASVKPVIVVSSGVSQYAAPPGHRTRTPERALAGLRRPAATGGVIRVENVHQLFDVAQLTLHQPMPTGDRVAVVGNSDALGSLSASAAESWGLRVTHGPVSLLPQASAEEFAHALDAAFSDPDVDSVVAAFIPPLVTPDEEVSVPVRDVVAKHDKPCVATFLGMRGVDGGMRYSRRRAGTVRPVLLDAGGRIVPSAP